MGRWPNKYVIGLTGNIAMGKSSIRKMIEHLGAYTIDADGLAHQVMAPGAPAYQPVIETFGRWILDKDKKVDRTKLGAVAFSHPEALTRLEALTHPIVGQGIDTLVSRAKQRVVVIEAIKLVDGVLGQQVDSVWVVDTSPQIQMERLVKRGLTEYEARKRIDTQNSQREKLAKASVVISNSGSLEDAWVQVQREWNRIVATLGLQAQPEDVVRVTLKEQPPTAVTPPPVSQTPQPVVQPPATTPPPQTRVSTPQQVPPMVRPASIPPPAAEMPKQPTTVTPIKSPEVAATVPPPPVYQPLPTTDKLHKPITSVDIRRGMPWNAEEIARMINQTNGKSLTRTDIMDAFGQKSYLLAEANSRVVGLAGFQVENLITRMDEFVIAPDVPLGGVADALIRAVENASNTLQSEISFMFLPLNTPPAVMQAFTGLGYSQTDLDGIRVPAWREAAQESQPPNTLIMQKPLGRRVLKPI